METAEQPREVVEARKGKAAGDPAPRDRINSPEATVGEAQDGHDSLRAASSSEPGKAKVAVSGFFDEVAEVFEPEGNKKSARHGAASCR